MTDNEFMTIVKEKLSPGKYWGGYKQICELLNEPDLSKNARKKKEQIKNWNRFFEGSQIDNSKSWVIKTVFDNPIINSELVSKEDLTATFTDILVKIIAEERKNISKDRDPNVWIGSNKRISNDLALSGSEIFIANEYMYHTVPLVRNELLELLKITDKDNEKGDVTTHEIIHNFERIEKKIRYTVEKAMEKLGTSKVALVQKQYVLINPDTYEFHVFNNQNPEDVEFMKLYNIACVDLMKEYKLEDDNFFTLLKHHISPYKYRAELDELLEGVKWRTFQAYVVYIMPYGLEYYYKTRKLDEVDINELRTKVHTVFTESLRNLGKKYAQDHKSKLRVIKGDLPKTFTINYELVCDYIIKQYVTYSNYNSTKNKLGYQNIIFVDDNPIRNMFVDEAKVKNVVMELEHDREIIQEATNLLVELKNDLLK